MATDKALEGIKSFQAFCDQFGEDDVFKKIFLEELFKFLYDEFIHSSSFAADEPSP